MKKNLTMRELVVMGGALFSMHFGAACMLFPVQWGKDAGSLVFLVFLGVLISGVILPFLGYYALVRGDGTFVDITRRAAPKFGTFFIAVTILVLGPIYLVPRMSAAAWAAIVQLSGFHTDSMIPVVLFSIAYYLVAFWFVSSKGSVMDKIGKILFPILIIVVTAVIIKSIATPISHTWTKPSFHENPVAYGFLQGYATGDLQCALMFGLVIVHGIRNAGIGGRDINRNLIRVGVVGLGLLMLTILGHMIAGANTGGTIHLTLSALYTQMVLELWGSAGAFLFNIALIAAALTTAVGAIASTSEIWEELLKEKKKPAFSYRNLAIASCVISCLISFADLDTIVEVIEPVLDACYPAAIVIAVYYCFDRLPNAASHLVAMKYTMIAAFCVSILSMLEVYSSMFGFDLGVIRTIYEALPLSGQNLAWLPISVAVFAVVLGVQSVGGRLAERSRQAA